MFDLLLSNNYEERKVDRYETDSLVISTAAVDEGIKTYETAILDTEYHDIYITVEAYDTYDQAIDGHKRWVETMKSKPDQLRMINNSKLLMDISEMLGIEVDNDLNDVFPRKVI